jgi:hypothetical protein
MGTGLIRFLLAFAVVILLRRLWRGLRGTLEGGKPRNPGVQDGGATSRAAGGDRAGRRLSSEQPIEDAEYEELD